MALKCIHNPKRKKNSRAGQGSQNNTACGVCRFAQTARSHGHRGQERGEEATATLAHTINALEQRVRLGETSARRALSGFITTAAVATVYGEHTPAMHMLDIEHFPDITMDIIVATLPAKQHEDTFVAFLRGSIPILNSYKKIHRDVPWPIQHEQSARLLLALSLPTLLSLFLCKQCKDVCFALRVRLFCEVRALLCAPHAVRAAFIAQNKCTLRLCLVEYSMHSMRDMPPLPFVPSCQRQAYEVHFRAASNMGQHFRVDINSLAPLAQSTSSDALWASIGSFAQILYDRYVRVCKTSDRSGRRAQAPVVHRATTGISQTQIRSTLHTVLSNYAEHVSQMPLITSFDVAEMYMRRMGIPLRCMSVLWDCRNYIRTFPLPAAVMRRQVQSLARACGGDHILMQNRSNLLVCTFCLTQNVVTAFRYDGLNGKYVCNRCEVPSATVDVSMLGRIVYVREIPLVLCTLCCEIVIWSGTSFEVSCCPQTTKHPLFHCESMHIAWGQEMNVNAVHNMLQNCSHGHFVLRTIHKPKPPRRIMRFYPDLSIDHTPHGSQNHCSICRTSNIFSKHILLDPGTRTLVQVQTCFRHTVHNHVSRYALKTVADFIRLQLTK